MRMKARVMVEIRPFNIPDCLYLKADQGDTTVASVKLSEVEESTLSALCDEFRAKVFKAAGKTDPRLK